MTLHDMDDLQSVAERNASGREVEAVQARSVLRSELGRFERWLEAQDVTPTIAALRSRADEIVERVLAENESRWEALSEADRERLPAMARAIVSRLLHEPTLQLRRAGDDDDTYVKVAALRELFGLDGDTEPLGGRGRGARASSPRRAGLSTPRWRPRFGLGTQGKCAGAGPGRDRVAGARRRRGRCGEEHRRRSPVTRSASSAASRTRCSPARSTSGSTRPRTSPASCPAGWRSQRSRAARTPPTRTSARRARSPTSRRALGSAPRACGGVRSSLRCDRTSTSWRSTATSTPASASSRLASATGSSWPWRGCAGWAVRTRSPSHSHPRR